MLTSNNPELKVSRMTKRCVSKNLFTRETFKLREFILTPNFLKIFDVSGGNRGKEKEMIPLSAILFVEKVTNEELDGKKHVFQVGYREEDGSAASGVGGGASGVGGGSRPIIYVVASSQAEQNDWITLIRFYTCERMAQYISHFHPGVYKKPPGRWSCCDDINRRCNGCQLVTPPGRPHPHNAPPSHSSTATGVVAAAVSGAVAQSSQHHRNKQPGSQQQHIMMPGGGGGGGSAVLDAARFASGAVMQSSVGGLPLPSSTVGVSNCKSSSSNAAVAGNGVTQPQFMMPSQSQPAQLSYHQYPGTQTQQQQPQQQILTTTAAATAAYLQQQQQQLMAQHHHMIMSPNGLLHHQQQQVQQQQQAQPHQFIKQSSVSSTGGGAHLFLQQQQQQAAQQAAQLQFQPGLPGRSSLSGVQSATAAAGGGGGASFWNYPSLMTQQDDLTAQQQQQQLLLFQQQQQQQQAAVAAAAQQQQQQVAQQQQQVAPPPPPSSLPPPQQVVIAVHNYNPMCQNQLVLQKGERYTVVDSKNPQWWYVRDAAGQAGYVPTNYIQRPNSLTTYDWYYKDITRQQAESILLDENREGCFLVRDSATKKNSLTLSVTSKDPDHNNSNANAPQKLKVHHYHIIRQESTVEHHHVHPQAAAMAANGDAILQTNSNSNHNNNHHHQQQQQHDAISGSANADLNPNATPPAMSHNNNVIAAASSVSSATSSSIITPGASSTNTHNNSATPNSNTTVTSATATTIAAAASSTITTATSMMPTTTNTNTTTTTTTYHYYLSEKHMFRSVHEVIHYHKHNSGGLVVRLRSPPTKDKELPVTAGMGLDDFELDQSELQLEETPIGKGQFGVVLRGTFRGLQVAVKQMVEGAMNEDDFIDEARNMRCLNHANLVQLFGVVMRRRPIMIITEFMKHGSLRDFLRSRYEAYCSRDTLLADICVQIGNGMAYLEQEQFIHRDLAARNCLVKSVNRKSIQVKVADFGMARFLLDNVYEPSAGTKFPVRWAPPEVFHSSYTLKADVWSFGVLMWEVFTCCTSMPYHGMNNNQVYQHIQAGGRLQKPAVCPEKLYMLMLETWQHDPTKRPTFKRIHQVISDFLD